MLVRISLIVVLVLAFNGCGGNTSSNQGNSPSSAGQSDDAKARSSLESFVRTQESATMKVKNFDISKTNSITSPYEATLMCEKQDGGRTWKAVCRCVYRDGQWSLVDTKLLD